MTTGAFEDVHYKLHVLHEQFRLIYSTRKVMHPLLVRLLAIAVDESLLNS